MSFYDDMAATATELLTEFGQAVTVNIKTGTVYDTSIAAMTVTSIAQPGIGALFDLGSRDVNGSMVQSGDKKLLLSVSGMTATPKVDDTVDISGITYPITSVNQISPAGVKVMYKCMLRGV